jgi:hypothetical protein
MSQKIALIVIRTQREKEQKDGEKRKLKKKSS